MSKTLDRIRNLVARGEVISSVHGFRELAADGILLDDVTDGVKTAIVVEEYPEAFKGPSVLVLQQDRTGKPLHVLWGIPKGSLVRQLSSRRIGQTRPAGQLTS